MLELEVSEVRFHFLAEKGHVKIYSLLDLKMGEHGGLVLAMNDATVRRVMLESLDRNKGQSTVEKYPADFGLYCLGNFDPLSGVIEPEVPRRLVALVSDILTPQMGG